MKYLLVELAEPIAAKGIERPSWDWIYWKELVPLANKYVLELVRGEDGSESCAVFYRDDDTGGLDRPGWNWVFWEVLVPFAGKFDLDVECDDNGKGQSCALFYRHPSSEKILD